MRAYSIAAGVSLMGTFILVNFLGNPSWAVKSQGGWFTITQYHGWVWLVGIGLGPIVLLVARFLRNRAEEEALHRAYISDRTRNASTPDERKYWGYVTQAQNGSMFPDKGDDIAIIRDAVAKTRFMRDFETVNPHLGFSIGTNMLPGMEQQLAQLEAPQKAKAARQARVEARVHRAKMTADDVDENITKITRLLRAMQKDHPNLASAVSDIDDALKALESLLEENSAGIDNETVSDLVSFARRRLGELEIDDPIILRRLRVLDDLVS